jgi:hypothetical protein
VAKWLLRPAPLPWFSPGKSQSNGANFLSAASRNLRAQQQACQPVTKEEYCINTVDSKLKNKQKECRERHQN